MLGVDNIKMKEVFWFIGLFLFFEFISDIVLRRKVSLERFFVLCSYLVENRIFMVIGV